jgi:Protein of unknown function (DUF1629)
MTRQAAVDGSHEDRKANMRDDDKNAGCRNSHDFYLMTNWARSTALGMKFINLKEVGRLPIPPSPWERGFRPYAVRPRFKISKRLGRRPPDVTNHGDYWFISGAAKRFLDAFCSDDFVHQEIDVEVDAGYEPADWWLCDVVHVLDAVDEKRSERLHTTVNDVGQKLHSILYASTVFDERIVDDHNVFRPKTSPSTIVCTARFKDAFVSAGLKGQTFLPAFEPSCDRIGTVTQVARHGTGPLAWWGGVITPDGRGVGIQFILSADDGWKNPPSVGERVRVLAHQMKWPSRGWLATLVTRLEPSDSGC